MGNDLTRRMVLGASGAVSMAALAGCGGPGEENDTDEEEPDGAENGEADDEWEDVDEFYFEGRVEAWTGLEPGIIDGEDNPTITLIEGNEYDFSWINADGVTHNLEIRDEDDEIIDDYQSDDVSEEGEETTLEGVVAAEEMSVYICTYHESTQVGDIDVQTD
ncbi:PKD domain-containing protein [Salinadaptatus halalkaliphilus]|uniref:PKD domain-containing protein n=2 Tax=Salinadaptatus halalkaliphilus TaxID=2419781 RepID=A0A4S3TNE9_9EURY|nr:PKD domain-containing protein [Salinadaptatus halalkaliphilus]